MNDEITSKIEAFATDIAALVQQAALEAVRTALGASKLTAPVKPAAVKPAAKPVAKAAPPAKPAAAPAKKPAPTPAPKSKAAAPAAKPAAKPAAPAPKAAAKPAPAKRPLGAKRPPAELAKLVERLGEYIKSNPGLGVEAIGKALATPTTDLSLPIKKLLAAKRIRFEGLKRATKYFPV